MAVATVCRPAEVRQRWVQILLIAGLVVIAARVFYIQVVARSYFIDEVAPLLEDRTTPLGPEPGSILANNGQPLARSLLVRTLVADPRLMVERGESLKTVAEDLAQPLQRPADDIYEQLWRRRNTEFAELAGNVSTETQEKIKGLKIAGLFFRSRWERAYPQGPLACHALGGRNRAHVALSGLEFLYRGVLDPQPGSGRADRRVPTAAAAPYVQPEAGKDLLLTIDPLLQDHVEKELRQVWSHERPTWVSAVVMQPQTGAIVATAALPNYDPNAYVEGRPAPGCRWSAVPSDATCNVPVEVSVEQGSTIKLLLIAAALDAKVVTPSTTLHCKGHIAVGGRPITCWGKHEQGGHGTMDMYGMIGQSCNVIASQVALRLGAARYRAFLANAGIGSDPEAGFPAESCGLLAPLNRIPPRDLASMGFGQRVSCSSLQLTSIVSGLVNGGIMEQPHVVQAVRNKDKTVFAQPRRQQRRICTAETSAIIRKMMQYTVEHGTGTSVQMPDLAVGGKTGTAQQWINTPQGNRVAGRYMVSFVEALPIDRPEYVIHVCCNQPQRGAHGSEVAAPVCKDIARFVVDRRLKRPHQAPAATAPPG